MKKVEHLGFAVSDIRAAEQTFARLLSQQAYKFESVEREGVTTAFFQVGETKIELLESTRSDSAISKFIAKKGEGMHHIAFDVEDIEAEMTRLRAEGFELLHDHPLDGADNKRICFIHPRSTHGVLVELCEEKKD